MDCNSFNTFRFSGIGRLVANIVVFAISSLGMPFDVCAATYYASPSGTSSGSGTESAPYDLSTGIGKASGNTLILKPGTYSLSAAKGLSGNVGTKIIGETGNPKDVIINCNGTAGFRFSNYVTFANITVTNCNNTSATSTNPQAGIRIGNITDYGLVGTVVVSNCVITGCYNAKTESTASSPSGIAVVYYEGLLVDSIVRENSCASLCSGVTLVGTNSAVVRCTIENNKANSGAGYYSGIYSPGGLGSVIDCVVQSNTASGYAPGIIYVPYISGTTVRGNSVPAGHSTSGVWASESGVFTMTNCVIEGNTADLYAGGLRLYGSTATIVDCTFRGNKAGNGGAVYHSSSVSSCTFKRCTFSENVAEIGSALYTVGNGRFIDCKFTENIATNGGAVAVLGASKTYFDGCTFACNSETATNSVYSGGAICSMSQTASGIVSCSNCVFATNRTQLRGGAIGFGYNNIARGAMVNCIFTNNIASILGGAVYVRDNKTEEGSAAPLLIRNSLVACNEVSGISTAHSGGGVCLISSNAVVDACTIAYNRTAGGVGAGFYHRWGGYVTNSIIACNFVKGVLEAETGWCLSTEDASDHYSHSLVYPAASEDFMVGAGCIVGMPKFTDPVNNNFTLSRRSSPGVDVGIIEDWMAGAYDLLGTNRVYNASVDMGAYECSVPVRGAVLIFK